MINATELNTVVSRYMSEADSKKVYDAFLLAAEAHEGVKRKSGEYYIFHPIEVAYSLAELRMDADTVCAALLHDVIEDTQYTKQDIADRFGDTIAKLVDGVTKLAGGEFTSRQEANAASFQKMMAAMVQDFRVVLIKLADRLHNVKTLGVRSPEARRRIARETLEIHAPLARRMGMNAMRKELQVIAFEHLHPWRAKTLKRTLDEFYQDRADIHKQIIQTLYEGLHENGIPAKVNRWDKNLYKFYNNIKNSKNRRHLNQLTQALELRVLVDSTRDCYAALGVVHQIYHPKIGSFKDFIATPKGYGFQALQTALLTRQQQLVVLQIQSHEMHKIAQYGVAAHLRYPELLTSSDKSQHYLKNWLAQVKEIQDAEASATDFLEDMKADLFLNEIYLSTPKGDTKVFPRGATPVDFAYAIHTEVGNRCVGASIDGEPCRLNTQLPNGATVEIFTSESATPQPAWLNFVVTAKARSCIRNWISKRKRHEFIALGKELLNKALMQYGSEIKLIEEDALQAVLQYLEIKDEDALFSGIGKGNMSAKIIARRLLGDDTLPPPLEDDGQVLLIKGTQGLLVELQLCCHPVPGDTIVAQLDAIKGLKVHRASCPTLKEGENYQKDREVHSIAWMDEISDEEQFLAPLVVQVRNRIGVLSHITDLLEEMRINIEEINISGDHEVKDLYFLLQVNNRSHLMQIAEAINNQSHVLNVRRSF